MDAFLKMDIFFVVATLATVAIAGLMIALLVYAIRFLRTVNRIGEEVEEEARAIREDIQEARGKMSTFAFSQVFSLLGKTVKRTSARAKRKTD